MPKTRGAWKSYERGVMALVGGTRIPVTGRQGPRGDPGDGVLPGFYVEIRDRARPRPVRWFREVVEGAAGTDAVPLLIFKGPPGKWGPLALLRWRDLAELVNRARSSEGDRQGAPGAGGAAPAGAGTGGGS